MQKRMIWLERTKPFQSLGTGKFTQNHIEISNTKVLSIIQQSQQGSSSTLDRTAGNMVLQSFDLGLNGGDNLPPYVGDFAPAASFYTDLDSTIYSQGKHMAFPSNPSVHTVNRPTSHSTQLVWPAITITSRVTTISTTISVQFNSIMSKRILCLPLRNVPSAWCAIVR